MDLQEAYKILGVSENATSDEIEEQYMKWVKRDNAYQSQPNSAEKSFDIDSITNAYNTIKSYESGTQNEFHSFREKVEHFFRYYKFHTLGVILLIIVSISIIQGIVDHRQEQKALASLPPKDVSIMLYGEYFNPNIATDPVSKNVLDAFPSWERIPVSSNYFPIEANTQSDIGMQQKSAVTLATSKADVYIMDARNFERLVGSGMFQPLDEMDLSLKEDKLIYAKAEEDTSEHLYGVEITDTPIFNGVKVRGDKKIAAIRIGAKHKDNALKLISGLAKKSGE